MAQLKHCPGCGLSLEGAADGRAGWWRFRVRLYDMSGHADEPMADSDSDQEPDQPGREIARGLPVIVQKVLTAALAWHGVDHLYGMSPEDLDQKIRGLRPTLSRRGGNATMRIEYDTRESVIPSPDHIPRYLARVDILKAAAPDGETVETAT